MYSQNGGEGGTGGGGDAGWGHPSIGYGYGAYRAENYLGGGGASNSSQAAESSQYATGRNGGSGIIIVRYKYQ